MGSRDEMFGVMGGWRDDVNPASIESAREIVTEAALQLGWELHGRSSAEKLSDAEVSLLNAVSLLESYKVQPWQKYRAREADVAPAKPGSVRTTHLEKMRKDLEFLRNWFSFLERDIAAAAEGRGVIGSILLVTLSEKCTAICYNAGIVNGSVLDED